MSRPIGRHRVSVAGHSQLASTRHLHLLPAANFTSEPREEPLSQCAGRGVWGEGLRQNVSAFRTLLRRGCYLLLKRFRELPRDLGEHLEVQAKTLRVGVR